MTGRMVKTERVQDKFVKAYPTPETKPIGQDVQSAILYIVGCYGQLKWRRTTTRLAHDAAAAGAICLKKKK